MEKPGLSEAALSVWAKSRKLDDGSLPLWCHLDDSAGIAGRLWEDWLPVSVRDRISAALPGGSDDGRILATWLAGVHDIGKATPAFAMQILRSPMCWLSERMRDEGLQMTSQNPRRGEVPHGMAGQIILEGWLSERNGWRRGHAQQLAVVVGGHHGIPPTPQELVNGRRDCRELLGLESGQELWQQVQFEFLDRAAIRTGADARLEAWGDVRLPQGVQALLTAVVIIADWIASDDERFPYEDIRSPSRLDDGWRHIDLPQPWNAVEPPSSSSTFFSQRFDLGPETALRPIQESAIALAREMPEPGILIIEAPMGEGKSEAALTAAEVFAAKWGAGGVMVALPTRATSDAMFQRMLAWLAHVPDDDRERGALSVMLAHGKARFNDDYAALRYGVKSTSVDIDGDPRTQALAAHRWLSGRKKLLLSSFVVGTIDQLLFSALKAKHAAMLHLGLAGKIAIIDEAHAYDVYMSEYLERALEWLGANGVPVIVLSATLPAARRRAMVQAYEAGRSGGQPDEGSHPHLADDIGYPALVASSGGGPALVRGAKPSGRSLDINLHRLDDDVEELRSLLREKLSEGGCALVVRNTVRRVQETARALAAEDDPWTVDVAHSRFLAPDRAANDAFLRDYFGPPKRLNDLGLERPARHIVVASQVAEQSLDIDFDLLVTDLASADLVLQRMGRIHRHERTRPAKLEAPRCFITGVDWSVQPPEPVKGSRRVYGRHLLLRSLAVLRPFLDGERPLRLPDDIAPLVQAAYREEFSPPNGWGPAMDEAREEFGRRMENKRSRAATFLMARPDAPGNAILGWLHAGAGALDEADPKGEGRKLVRDTPAESVEVIVVVRRSDGSLITPPWLVDEPTEIPVHSTPGNRLAMQLATYTLALPIELCDAVEEIEAQACFPAWQESPWLEGQLILVLDENHEATIAGYGIHYDRWLGLEVTKNE